MLVGNNMIIEGKGRENARIHPMLVEISILFYMKLKLKKKLSGQIVSANNSRKDN